MESTLNVYLSRTRYIFGSIIKAEVKNFLQLCTTFSCNLESFENKHQMINLTGEIIPGITICIWLKYGYPDESPECYVMPKIGTKIKVSKYIDCRGKIYLPYLHDWNRRKHNLLGLVQVLIYILRDNPRTKTIRRSNSPPTTAKCPDQRLNTTYPPSLSHMSHITEEHLRLSLITAITDKLKRSNKELDKIKKINMKLQNGRKNLETILSLMDKEKEELANTVKALEEKNIELTEKLKQLNALQNSMNCDEIINPIKPLHKQILDKHAEESAVDEIIYYLSEFLRQGVIDLDTYLKKIRSLSIKQFMLKALIQKCREKAGLSI